MYKVLLVTFTFWISGALAQKVAAPEGHAGIVIEDAKTKVKIDKLRAIDWDKIQTVDELKTIVKALVKQQLQE